MSLSFRGSVLPTGEVQTPQCKASKALCGPAPAHHSGFHPYHLSMPFQMSLRPREVTSSLLHTHTRSDLSSPPVFAPSFLSFGYDAMLF